MSSMAMNGPGLTADQKETLAVLERTRTISEYDKGTLAALRLYGSRAEVDRIDRLTGALPAGNSGSPPPTRGTINTADEPSVFDYLDQCPTCGRRR